MHDSLHADVISEWEVKPQVMNEREIGYIVVNKRYVKTSVSNEGEKAFSILNSVVNI